MASAGYVISAEKPTIQNVTDRMGLAGFDFWAPRSLHSGRGLLNASALNMTSLHHQDIPDPQARLFPVLIRRVFVLVPAQLRIRIPGSSLLIVCRLVWKRIDGSR
jgi:hypothetical protein